MVGGADEVFEGLAVGELVAIDKSEQEIFLVLCENETVESTFCPWNVVELRDTQVLPLLVVDVEAPHFRLGQETLLVRQRRKVDLRAGS